MSTSVYASKKRILTSESKNDSSVYANDEKANLFFTMRLIKQTIFEDIHVMVSTVWIPWRNPSYETMVFDTSFDRMKAIESFGDYGAFFSETEELAQEKHEAVVLLVMHKYMEKQLNETNTES